MNWDGSTSGKFFMRGEVLFFRDNNAEIALTRTVSHYRVTGFDETIFLYEMQFIPIGILDGSMTHSTYL